MGIKLVLFDKLYVIDGSSRGDNIYKRYQKYILEIAHGFKNTKIHFKKIREYDKRIELFIEGPEEVFIKNLIQKEIGSVCAFKDLRVNMQLRGNMVDVGKVGFGIFVDCAIQNPHIDVLISLNTLRNQLSKDNKRSIHEIIRAYNFIDHFPISLKITFIDKDKNEVQGKLDDEALQLFQKLLKENLEAVFASGETKAQFKKALEKTGHYRDIVSIMRFGFLENIVILKDETSAPGIISDIGPFLKGCKLSAIRPERIKKLFN